MDGIELRDGETLSEEGVICPHCGVVDDVTTSDVLHDRTDRGDADAIQACCSACGGRISVVVLFHTEAVG